MSQIKLTPDDLRTSSKKYTEGSQEISQILKNLSDEQELIRENWKGSAFTSFDNQFIELQPKITEFAELLQQINVQLNSVADIVQETDEKIAAQIGN